ncbi:MAG: GTPase Era [Chloroflexota bacterium]
MLLNQTELSENYRSGFVAVIGRPNVGKSTLLNRVLGQKIAITSPKPQTTRDQVLGILTEDEAQIIFLDTPGIHKPTNKLGEYMMATVEEVTPDADVILWLVDGNHPPGDAEMMIAAMLCEMHGRTPLPPIVLGVNKIDKVGKGGKVERLKGGRVEELKDEGEQVAELQVASEQVASEQVENRQVDEETNEVDAPWLVHEQEYLTLLQWLNPADPTSLPVKTVAFSGLDGTHVDELLTTLRETLPVGPQYYPEDQVTDLQTRFIAAELIREKALLHLHQEIPHSIAVAVDEFKQRNAKTTFISAIIYVERKSHKGIVLGHKGKQIKQIGQSARPEIEELVGTKVYLELWVKVWEKWRRREGLLRQLGYAMAS